MDVNKLSDDKKQNLVKEVLMKSVVCDKSIGASPYEKDGMIFSGQKYYGVADADMSDLAIGFYNILYSNILDKQGILDGKYIRNCCFAGDTMNSFNTVANLVPEAGPSVKARTNKNTWPLWLQEYKKQYHCLANFWLLPKRIGRTSKKLNYYDSMDIFVNKISKDYDGTLIQDVSYFEKISTYEDFAKIHFIEMYGISDELELQNYKKKNAKVLVEQAQMQINERAEAISKSELIVDLGTSKQALWEALWEYFYDSNLIV